MAMDAIEVLTEDHRAINRAFLQYEDLPPGRAVERWEIVAEIKRRLMWHTAIEQQFLHPLVAAVPNGEHLVRDEIDEHREMTRLLRSLGETGAAGEGLDTLMRGLILRVRRHMEEEESQLFPLLRGLVDPQQLVEIGDAIRAARAGATSRPGTADG